MSLNNYTLDRTVPIPLYYQLKTMILAEIDNGSYPVGSTIPTENELSDLFQISRSTVRQAISELVSEGRLARRTSKGTIVTTPQNSVGYIRSFEPFYQQVEQSGKQPRTEVLRLEIIKVNDLAVHLGLQPEDKAICMFRRRFADDTPMVTMLNYLPCAVCDFILTHDFEKESLYEVLSINPEIEKAETKTIVSAEKATAKDAEFLKIKINSPILNFNTITKTDSGRVIDYAFSRYRGDLNRFEINARPG